jgi:hypothetical protein
MSTAIMTADNDGTRAEKSLSRRTKTPLQIDFIKSVSMSITKHQDSIPFKI